MNDVPPKADGFARAVERLRAMAERRIPGARATAALVVPGGLDASDAFVREELSVSLELVASLAPHVDWRLCSDDARLELPLPRGELDGCAMAFVALDAGLALRTSARLPTRLVGGDVLADRTRRWRITFTDPRVHQAARAEAPERGASVLLDHLLSPADVRAITERFPSARLYTTALRPRPGATVATPGTKADYATHPLLAAACGARALVSPDGDVQPFSGCDAAASHLYKGEDFDALGLLGRIFRVSAPSTRTAHEAPLISVVVPVYDRTNELLRLGESIVAQTYPNLEVILVSNGSPPNTLEALRVLESRLRQARIHCRHVRFERAFGHATIPRDVGSYAARGEFICYMDSDDYLDPGFFDFALAGRLADDTIYYPRRSFRNLGRRMPDGFPFDTPLSSTLPPIEQGLFEVLVEKGNFLNNSGAVISRAAFVRAGGIRHDLRYCEDYYLWLRLARLGARAREHEGVVNITLHPGNNELVVGDPTWIARAKDMAVEPLAP